MLYQSTGTISGGALAILWRGKPVSLDALIDKYCKSMIERNLSDNTIVAYTHVVKAYADRVDW